MWRASTSTELNGQLPTGASLYRVITAGGDTTQYVRTAASVAEKVVASGSYTYSIDDNGVKTFTFSGTSGKSMNVYTVANGSVVENKDWSSAYQVNYKVSSATQVTTTLYYKNTAGNYVQWTSGTLYRNYTKSTLSVSGTDTGSGSATLLFTPNEISAPGGYVKVTPYTPETVTEQKVGYYTRIPASANEETKTFLVQGSTATQSFAFEIDE